MTPNDPARILIVDDEESMRDMLEIALERDGHCVETCPDGASALAVFSEQPFDMVIQDLQMPGMNGIELLRKLAATAPEVPVVIMTAFSTWDTAVEAMRLGAYNYLKKPFDMDEVRATVRRALDRAAPPKGEEAGAHTVRFIGSTPVVQEILALVHRVAATDSTVVIQGESGTGKELIARLVHHESRRRAGPFISVNCGAFSETLLESEIFGHRKGAFTGAIADKKGMLEIADAGTFFLDEVGEMTLQTQVRLLRVLETREFIPVGDSKARRADVRFVAATNRDLPAMVERGTFREDLFYRLNVIPVHLPSLRERRADIPLLAGHFLALYNNAFGRGIDSFEDGVEEALMAYDWPGNVRELQNTIQRAVTLATGSRITRDEIIPTRAGKSLSAIEATGAAPATPLKETPAAARNAITIPENGLDLERTLSGVEAQYIEAALRKTGGNLTRAAELLGISFRSIRYKVKKFGISH